MADFWRQLPLSLGDAGDESSVSSDWRPKIASSLRGLADLLAALPPARWQEPTLRTGRGSRLSVQQVVEELVWRTSATRLELLFPSAPPSASPDVLLVRLRAAAERADQGEGRRSLGELTAVVERCCDITLALGLPDPVDPLASGAAALGRAAAAPAELRGVLLGRTLVATDAGWRIGRGPEIRASAALLVAWLSGRDVRPEFAGPGETPQA